MFFQTRLILSLSQELNNKLTLLQEILILHPAKSVFVALGFILLFLYVVHRLVGQSDVDTRRDAKSRNARLD
jgi:predicted RND superfamily exporter protein